MPRPQKIWYWKARKTWCVKINRVRHILGPDKEAAAAKFKDMMAVKEVPSGSVVDIADQFLDWTKKHRPASYEWYHKYLQGFIDSLPDKLVQSRDVTEEHVENFVDRPSWGNSTRRGAITAIKRCFNWAQKHGIKDGNLKKKIVNPITAIEKPPSGKREQYLTPAQYKQILKHTEGEFRMLIEMAWNTGARPRELLGVRAEHVDVENSRWVFPEIESKGKKRKRVVYLNDKALKLTKRLMKLRPNGTLLRTDTDRPWDRFAVANAFGRLKTKSGNRYRLYDFRFSFCTNGLKSGVDPITMQHLLGHTDLSMISRIYALVSQDVEHMRQAAKKAAQ